MIMCFKKLEKWANAKIKKMTLVDIKLIKLSVFAFALMVAKLWQPILSLDWYWYLVMTIVFAIRPCMKMCKK